MIGLVLGGGDCVWEDVKAAEALVTEFDAVAACNDMISLWPKHLDYACTLHSEKLTGWLRQRELKGGNRPECWTHKKSSNSDKFTSDWQGSSGLFCVKILMEEGFDKIIVCGVPMDPRVGHIARHKPWGAAPSYHIGWTRNFAIIAPHVRSFSGWTGKLLGQPTKEWLSTKMEAPKMAKPVIRVTGMHGLGDNIHQRAILRQLMLTHTCVLETSWVSVYHDLIAQGLYVVHKSTVLRTQTKNARREISKFARNAPRTNKTQSIYYTGDQVRAYGSVVGAMCHQTECSHEHADFRLPVPDHWLNKARVWLEQKNKTGKPLMLLRPVTERSEWSATMRNPRPEQFAELFDSVRDHFFVVSVADLEPGKEWLVNVQPKKKPDEEVHKGEFDFEMLAAMFKLATLVFTGSGFAIPLSQAVETPVVAVFGGYENRQSFSLGERWSKWLPIQPITVCSCFRHTCPCDKKINMKEALPKLRSFVEEICASGPNVQHPHIETRPAFPPGHIGAAGASASAAPPGIK